MHSFYFKDKSCWRNWKKKKFILLKKTFLSKPFKTSCDKNTQTNPKKTLITHFEVLKNDNLAKIASDEYLIGEKNILPKQNENYFSALWNFKTNVIVANKRAQTICQITTLNLICFELTKPTLVSISFIQSICNKWNTNFVIVNLPG